MHKPLLILAQPSMPSDGMFDRTSIMRWSIIVGGCLVIGLALWYLRYLKRTEDIGKLDKYGRWTAIIAIGLGLGFIGFFLLRAFV